MVLNMIFAFAAGGLVGIMGMSWLAYGSKIQLIQENRIYRQRLEFLEKEAPKRERQPVEDPRVRVHALVN
jgi:hypothetical protein